MLRGVFNFFRREDLGQPIKNLEIELTTSKTSFDDEGFMDVLQEIEFHGNAIAIARRLLKGNHYLTDKGYLIRGREGGFEPIRVELDIDEHSNVGALLTMDKVRKGEIEDNDSRLYVSFHLPDGGVFSVKHDGSHLYETGYRRRDEIRGLSQQILDKSGIDLPEHPGP
jgi:hypothetical protein